MIWHPTRSIHPKRAIPSVCWFAYACPIFLLAVLSPVMMIAQPEPRNGKLLRGELWEPFVATEQADFYVSKEGNDQWSGTLAKPNATGTDGPFATLHRAQIAVRHAKTQLFTPKEPPVETRWIGSPHVYGKGKDLVVLIRQGYYELPKPLMFGPEDGGERIETNLPTGAFEYHKLRDHYVTYAAYPGEKPVLSGGHLIEGWQKEALHWRASGDGGPIDMLVAAGRKQVLARAPNEGYFVPPKISATTEELYFNPGEIAAWPDMEDNRVHMLLRWHQGHNSIDRLDIDNGIAYLSEPQAGVVVVPPRYYVENVKALMDHPGEWYYDRGENQLFWMPGGETPDPNAVDIAAPHLDQLLVIRGDPDRPLRNLRFYGLTFEGTLPGQAAIEVTYAHATEFVGNEMRAMAGTGMLLSTGCYQTKILHNRIDGADNMAIRVHGPNEPASGRDILRETEISFNYISDCGGVNIDAAFSLFTTISHNYITRTRGRYAISVGGWRNLEEAIDGAYTVEYNHLYDVQRDADDSGAIKTAGTTFNSVVQKNLVHDVRAGFFNDNVGFWFDNMSLGWIARDNIFYNLEQGEMKLCAANLVDNLYENNYVIEAPKVAPEIFIEGEPQLRFEAMELIGVGTDGNIRSGDELQVRVKVFNEGSTGLAKVPLYVDGKLYRQEQVPVVRHNSDWVSYDLRLYDAGEHQIAVGSLPYRSIQVTGARPAIVFEDLSLSHTQILEGEEVVIRALAKNLSEERQSVEAILWLNDGELEKRHLDLAPGETQEVTFRPKIESGKHSIRIGNSGRLELEVKDYRQVDLTGQTLGRHCSAKAKPFDLQVDQRQGSYRIEVAGTDFFHAEDSYAAVFLPKLQGDFVATVKIREFGHRTHEWFRAGLFARNDMVKSFDTRPGSKGSFLMFGTPGRAGINYDEFANGCMHKASSKNLPEHTEFPIWLKLERHGDYFVGALSVDGKTWINEQRSGDIPGLQASIDLGLAAGSCDQVPYWVQFEDWQIKVER